MNDLKQKYIQENALDNDEESQEKLHEDIIDAIVAQTDEQIAQHRSAHQKHLSELREKSERNVASKKQEVSRSKEERKEQMIAKAHAHAAMFVRNAELSKKQELLNTLYEEVGKKLGNLPKDKLEGILKKLLSQIHAAGSLNAAKPHADLVQTLASNNFTVGETIDGVGGFVFHSDKQERDCTFEHLVLSVLRPATEVDSATSLFSAA